MTMTQSARAALRTSEIRYRRLFEEARDGILILSAVTLKIIDANPSMTELLGFSLAEIIGKELWEIGLFGDQDTSDPTFQKLHSTGYVRYERLPLLRKSGESREVEFVSSVYTEEANQVIQCNIRDITERSAETVKKHLEISGLAPLAIDDRNGRQHQVLAAEEHSPPGLPGFNGDGAGRKKLEEQLRQADKLNALCNLAGGIAHDFNNILGAIIGYSEMAQREIPPDSGGRVHIEQVLFASARAAELVAQILTFSRQRESNRKPVQMKPLVEETLKLLQASIPSTIEIHRRIDASTQQVLGDYTQLQQMIVNLCANAMRSMKKQGGILEVCLTSLTVSPDFARAHPEIAAGPNIRLTVSDTGSGMDSASQEHIFEPFFKANARGEGAGLGLAVVHGVIKNHGGAITVYSEPDVGTTFNIYLPVHDGPPVTALRNSIYTPRGIGEHNLKPTPFGPLESIDTNKLTNRTILADKA